jgi:hypothetical protein
MAEAPPQAPSSKASKRGVVAESLRTLTAAVRRSSFLGAAGCPGDVRCATAVLGARRPSLKFTGDGAKVPERAASRARAVRVALPRRLFIVKEVLLPGTESAELQGMLELEAPGLFPVPADEVTWGWYPLEVTGEGYTRLRVVAVETSALEEHLLQIGLAGDARACAEPSTVSLSNYVLAALGSWPERPVAVVAACGSEVELAVVGPLGLEFDRGIELAGAGDEGVAAQVVASLSLYSENSRAGEIAKVYTLALPQSPLSAETLHGRTGLPVEPLPEPDFVRRNGPPDASSVIAAGAALGPLLSAGAHVNLTSPVRVERLRSSARRQAAFFTTALIILTLAFLWGALALRAHRLEGFVETLQARVDEVAPIADQTDAKRQRLAAIQRQLTGRGTVLDIVLELYKVTPPDIYLVSLELDKSGLLTIKGHANEMYRAVEYGQILDKNKMFGRATQSGVPAHQTTESDKTFIKFTIIRDLSEGK